jgi:hypothetical protein
MQPVSKHATPHTRALALMTCLFSNHQCSVTCLDRLCQTAVCALVLRTLVLVLRCVCIHTFGQLAHKIKTSCNPTLTNAPLRSQDATSYSCMQPFVR